MRIVELTAENIKCLSAITITPDPDESVVTVGGLNGAGKSTALDCIEYAVGGVRGIPAVPIRTGETKARIVLDLDAEGEFPALRVERRFSVKGGSDLIVTSGGKRQSSPQSILDALHGRVGFDPLAFTREKPAEQRRILQGLVGLDFTEADKRRATLFEQRTTENRTVKDLTAQAAGMETFADAPQEETSANALIEEIQAVKETNRVNQNKRDLCERLRVGCNQDVEDLDALEKQLAAIQERISQANERLTLTRNSYATAREVTDKLTDQPTDALQEQLDKCEETNRQVRANAAAKDLAIRVERRKRVADKLTGQLERIDEDKQAGMESAEWPVEGLGFSDDGVMLDGLPFEQASQAQKIDVSVAMGFAQNPTLRVMLIRDGSLLDDASLARIATLAAEKDGQVWLERVGEGDCSVIIRDGEVVQAEETDA